MTWTIAYILQLKLNLKSLMFLYDTVLFLMILHIVRFGPCDVFLSVAVSIYMHIYVKPDFYYKP